MEFIQGMDLEQYVSRKGPLPIIEACSMMIQVADGMQYAHSQKSIHRDIKPANLMLLDKTPLCVKVLDFGLAKAQMEIGDPTGLTNMSTTMGTVSYIAPEQTRSSAIVDIRADIYSMGCTFYYLLTGQPPFTGTQYDVIECHRTKAPPPAGSLRPGIPKKLESILAKMMAKNPSNRFQEPIEIATTLRSFLQSDCVLQSPSNQNPCASERAKPQPLLSWFGTRRFIAAIGLAFVPILLFMGILIFKTSNGTIVLDPLPVDAEVFIDNQKITVRWQENREKATIQVAPGNRELLVKWNGSKLQGSNVKIGPGETVSIGIRLDQKASHESEVADEVVDSVPSTPTNPTTTLPSGEPSQDIIVSSIGIKLIRILPGEFMMGSPPGEADYSEIDEFLHPVTITRPFYLGIHEVTRGQFARFARESGYFGKRVWNTTEVQQTDQHPVLDRSYTDAIAFCKWLSEKDGRTYSLPTEAEWEYACRAGTKTAFWFGDDVGLLTKYGNQGGTGDGYRGTSPVGSFPPNAFGLFDMHGNTWEWCSDWYDPVYYKSSPKEDPKGPAFGSERVLRGGSRYRQGMRCRSASRNKSEPEGRQNFHQGFRIRYQP